eukprot:758777-Hanusia_phi.AAC.1
MRRTLALGEERRGRGRGERDRERGRGRGGERGRGRGRRGEGERERGRMGGRWRGRSACLAAFLAYKVWKRSDLNHDGKQTESRAEPSSDDAHQSTPQGLSASTTETIKRGPKSSENVDNMTASGPVQDDVLPPRRSHSVNNTEFDGSWEKLWGYAGDPTRTWSEEFGRGVQHAFRISEMTKTEVEDEEFDDVEPTGFGKLRMEIITRVQGEGVRMKDCVDDDQMETDVQ